MRWCPRNEVVLVTVLAQDVVVVLVCRGVSRVLPGAGRIPKGHRRAGQGELGPNQRQFSSQSHGITSSEPLSAPERQPR